MLEFNSRREIKRRYKEKRAQAKERYKERNGLKIARGFNNSPAARSINYWESRKLFEFGVEQAKKKLKKKDITNEIPLSMYWNNFGVGGEIDQALQATNLVYPEFFVIVINKIEGWRRTMSYDDYAAALPDMYQELDDLSEVTGKTIVTDEDGNEKEIEIKSRLYPFTGANIYESADGLAYGQVLITID